MKALKTILQCKYLYYSISLFAICFCIIYTFIPHISKYDINDNIFYGKIIDIYIDGNYLSMVVKAKEKIQTTYYFKTYEEKEKFIKKYNLGDIVCLNGTLTIPNSNTNINAFNYRKYLYYEGIYYILKIDSYYKISDNESLFYKLKNGIIDRIKTIPKSNHYLSALILGDDRYISNDTTSVYQTIGISHLLAISGMHIGLFTKILHFVLDKIYVDKKIKYIVIILFLLFYLFLTGFIPSILRAVTFFMVLSLSKLLKLNVKTIYLYLLTLSIIILLNPFIIYKVGFQYSSIISLGLILFSNLINNRKNHITKLLMTSFVSFVISVPICIYYFYQINFFSIIFNLFFVPFMSFILFPLSLLTFVFPVLDSITYNFISLFELFANLCAILPGVLIFKKINFLICVLYLLFIFIILNKNYKQKLFICLLIIAFCCHYFYNNIFNHSYIMTFEKTTTNMIQKISSMFAVNPLFSKGI